MKMAFRILWRNWHKVAVISASSQNEDFPLAFLSNQIPTLVHKTTGVASEWWKWDLGAARNVRYFIFWNHNFSPNASIRLQANSIDNWTSPAIDVYINSMPEKIVKIFETVNSYRWWRLIVEDSGNSEGYLQGGYAFLGDFLETGRYFSEIQITDIDPSKLVESDDGQASAILKSKYWIKKYDFQGLSENDINALREAFDYLGKANSFYIHENSNDESSIIYVRTNIDWSYSCIFKNYFNFSLSVEKMR
jgi:hypothetical protein